MDEVDKWPLEQGRVFASEFFTVEELTEKQQENDWLREGGPDDEVDYYPTYDYRYGAYECLTIDELKAAFLYGNWAIRQCFTYKNLAFINQINAGDEWLTLKKFEDGRLLDFESITMIRTINHEVRSWVEDFDTSEYEDDERVRVVSRRVAEEHAEALTMKFHSTYPSYGNKKARYEVDAPENEKKDFGIYFVDVAGDYFPEYIGQLLTATYEQCRSLDYLDDEFKKRWRQPRGLRVHTARELQEGIAE